MPSIEEANINFKITRIELAKMLSYYAINVLWETPDERLMSDIIISIMNYVN